MERFIDRMFWRFTVTAAAVFLVVMLVRSCSQWHTQTTATPSANATAAVLPKVKPSQTRAALPARVQPATTVPPASAGITTRTLATASSAAATTVPRLIPPTGLAAGFVKVIPLPGNR